MNVTRILLPVDGSRLSDAAADMAIDIAASFGASIVLLHVRKPVPSGLGQPNADELLQYLIKNAEAVMAHYRGKLGNAKVDYLDLIIGGEVAEVIANVAEVEKCELIVMGSRGRSDLAGLILGSVTHKVLNISACPVLVVK
ncbi:MAG: universal stress protein [Pseudodesulfovibrio sp.]|uniref:UspA domain-containing protein n=1 Tax=Pseudodesulfovibrio aespoeensis (strain ATCC 700646 / DSM 10631 / Aspo-2) TaxID=643562 RepID=E6VSD0_PSEA9|nr:MULTISPECIES: universal stress protein [Pseudodesulfovibrio]MBU4192288.1 universal stress protein [Pseudomonadota bacterium]ADU64273.1 UspA domain-containing protein [Pseudodesulfovibrio aespoeensis Aspo-2]MBU4243689.1 universal stress protein [Pseudomonadota bacterium]MBU4378415.1 universal stress protein [Pseudomonadota bacterium]MBU4475657.1 universal stress protein [Pseudomonadota bacterium]